MLKSIKKIWVVAFLVIIILFIQIVLVNKYVNHGEEQRKSDDLCGDIKFINNRTDKGAELNKLIDEFEEIYPNVNVKLELIGEPEEILERKASVGDLPDVTLVPDNITSKEFNKYFLPIDDLGYNEDNMYSYLSGVGDDNSLYNLTTSTSWRGIIYNKNIFENVGIKSIPRTEQEFFEVCDKIKKSGIIPVALNCRQSWVMSMWIDTIPNLYNIDMEAEMIGKSKDVLGKDSEIYKALNFAKKIYSNGYSESNIENYDWAKCKDDMSKGKIAMIIITSDFINQLVDLGMDRESIGMFPIPETTTIRMLSDFRIGISKNTKYPEASKKFLKFLFEDDRYAKAVNIMSSLKDSESTIDMIGQLEKFNLPIIFQDDIMKAQDEEQNEFHDEYLYLKKMTGLNYNFIQNYITADDTDSLEKTMNENWKEYRDGK